MLEKIFTTLTRLLYVRVASIIALGLCLLWQDAAAQTARDPLKWPFAQNSIWNMPIGSNAVYRDAGIVSPKDGMRTDENILILTPNAPKKDFKEGTSGWPSNNWDRCNPTSRTWYRAGVPDNFVVNPSNWKGRVPNLPTAVLMDDGKTLKQGQPFARCSNGSNPVYKYPYPEVDIYGDGIRGAHGGAGMSSIGGAIRMGELLPGSVIKHALKVEVWSILYYYYDRNENDGKRGYRWPAVKADAGAAYSGCDNYAGNKEFFQMGSLMALKPDFNVNGLRTEPGRIIARALQDYGGYIVDNTCWDIYAIATEWSPEGRVIDEFEDEYGYPFDFKPNNGTQNSDWGRDIIDVFTALHVVDNNGPNSIGGGGTPRAPLAPPFGDSNDPIYTLTVNGGTGGGLYTAGTSVSIAAAPAPVGQIFDAWTGETSGIANLNSPNTILTMPEADATISATYRAVTPADCNAFSLSKEAEAGDNTRSGTARTNNKSAASGGVVIGYIGQGANNYLEINNINVPCGGDYNLEVDFISGETRTLYVDVNGGDTFTRSVNSGGWQTVSSFSETISLNQGNNTLKFYNDGGSCPDIDQITVMLTNGTPDPDPETYTLSVTSGDGDGDYLAGAVVNISSASAPAGQEFDMWTGDVSGIADVSAASTTLTMPASDVSITATYRDLPPVTFMLTVNQGIGDGDYEAGMVVNITADMAPAGQEFDAWTGDVSGVADVSDPTTSITMGASDATVSATYKDLPPAGGEVLVKINFQPSGSAVPSGYIRDRGQAYGSRSGFTFGWLGGANNNARQRSGSAEMKLRTFNHMAKNGNRTWEISVPNGTYSLEIGCADLQYTDQVNTLNVEGVMVTDPDGQDNIDIYTNVVVQVTDGRLTISPGSGSSNPKISYVDIETTGTTAPPMEYTLTVSNGSGDGNYEAGEVVNISADMAPSGQEFDRWTGATAGVADVNDPTTTVTMPASNITVTATYVDVDDCDGFSMMKEAEAGDNTLNGTARLNNKSAASGGTVVGYLGKSSNDYLEINNIMVPCAGDYTLQVDYISGNTRTISMSVNGGSAVARSVNSGDWNTVDSYSLTVSLNAGSNTIKFFNNTDAAPDIDKIMVSSAGNARFGSTSSVDASALTLYPNPARSVVNFSKLFTGAIYNSLGVKVKTVTQSKFVDISDLKAGLYHVISSDQKTLRLVID